jgi:hypothetical protein
MALPPISSELCFLDAGGQSVSRPEEWAPGWLEIPATGEDWDRCRVILNGVSLPISMRVFPKFGRKVVAEWPRVNPGRHAVRIITPATENSYEIAILPDKISPEAFTRLVDELEGQLPASIALSLQRLGAFGKLRLRPLSEMTRSQDLIRLQRAVDGTSQRMGLITVLRELAKDPHGILQGFETWVSADRARRPHPALLVRAITREGNLDAQLRPIRVIDSRAQHTYDVYENRVVALYANAVRSRLRRLANGNDAATALPANELLSRLIRARRTASFLDSVSLPDTLPTRVTMVLLRRPAYRAAFEGYLEFFRSPFVTLDEPGLDAPLDNVPHLYQVWGTLHIVDVALSLASELGYQVLSHALTRRKPDEIHLRILPDGKPLLFLAHPANGARVDIIPERRYPSGSGPLHSITYEQRPDVAIEVRRPGDQLRIYLFDPKYKLDSEIIDGVESTKPKKVDLDKMHAYRDAIRDSCGLPVVRYAAILYPGEPERYPPRAPLPHVEALQGYPGREAPLRARLQEVLREALDPMSLSS